jgi:thiamine pyrophosphokinase
MNKIFFPQGTLCIEDNQPVQEVAFSVCGGRKPAGGWLKMTAEKLPGTPEFFAADKGLNYYHAANILPDKVVGDGDSADPLLWQQAVKSGKAEIFPADKDKTDLQLLLEKLPPEKLWIVSGIFGGRLDHLLSAFVTLGNAALQQNRTIVLADEREISVFVPAGVKTEFYPPAEETPVAVSLLAFTEKSRVSVRGTKWQLEDKVLNRDNPYAISNEMSEAEKMKELPHISFSCIEGMTIFYVAG